MRDLLFLAVTLAVFACAAAFVGGCARIVGRAPFPDGGRGR
ncbi:MAG TPA: hypothetical protein VFI83_10305 [Gaiella sp.]|nr:hypothetical protein [Gaiella sp.]